MKKQSLILITGCSSGFGMLMAKRLTASGHIVIATMRDTARCPRLLQEMARSGPELKIFELDVTNSETIERTVKAVMTDHGRIDVLINNAGYGIGGFFEDLSQEEIRAQMETNFFGVQNVIRAVLPHMRAQKAGKIINISSVAGFSTSPAFGAYNASKWALEAFSESLYYELKPFGIHVAMIEPGTYNTKIFHDNARYAENFDDPKSPYFKRSQHLRAKVMTYVNQCRKNPEMIAILAEKLIDHPAPPLRNIPDLEAKILYFLRKFLPFGIYRRMIETVLFADLAKD